MDKDDNPWEILKVSRDASEEEIKKAFRKGALMYHPDRHLGDDDKATAHDIFAKFSAAYETLTDPVKLYDWKLEEEKRIEKAKARQKKGPSPNLRKGEAPPNKIPAKPPPGPPNGSKAPPPSKARNATIRPTVAGPAPGTSTRSKSSPPLKARKMPIAPPGSAAAVNKPHHSAVRGTGGAPPGKNPPSLQRSTSEPSARQQLPPPKRVSSEGARATNPTVPPIRMSRENTRSTAPTVRKPSPQNRVQRDAAASSRPVRKPSAQNRVQPNAASSSRPGRKPSPLPQNRVKHDAASSSQPVRKPPPHNVVQHDAASSSGPVRKAIPQTRIQHGTAAPSKPRAAPSKPHVETSGSPKAAVRKCSDPFDIIDSVMKEEFGEHYKDHEKSGRKKSMGLHRFSITNPFKKKTENSSKEFKKLDSNHDKSVSKGELSKYIESHTELWATLGQDLNLPIKTCIDTATNVAFNLACGLSDSMHIENRELTEDEFKYFHQKFVLDEKGSREFYLRTFFAVFDLNGDGVLNAKELNTFLELFYKATDLFRGSTKLPAKKDLLLIVGKRLDANKDGVLDFGEIRDLLDMAAIVSTSTAK